MLTSFGRDTRGAALIEAALTLPVLLVVVFGLTDLSLYVWQQSLAQKAAQLGLRKAVVSASAASGPGLSGPDSTRYWDGLVPGVRCTLGTDNPCPAFQVRCTVSDGCLCGGARCGFSLSGAGFAPIVAAMRAVLPELRPENVEIGYATNGLGYVGRPVPVPVDVSVHVVGFAFRPAMLGGLFPSAIPIRASAFASSEDLVSE